MENQGYSLLLGYVDFQTFLVMLLFATVGVSISLLIDSRTRDKLSSSTPEKFSLKFLVRDNRKTIGATILIILATLRFLPMFFPGQFQGDEVVSAEGMDKWLFGCLMIGGGFNYLLQMWKKKTSGSFLKTARK